MKKYARMKLRFIDENKSEVTGIDHSLYAYKPKLVYRMRNPDGSYKIFKSYAKETFKKENDGIWTKHMAFELTQRESDDLYIIVDIYQGETIVNNDIQLKTVLDDINIKQNWSIFSKKITQSITAVPEKTTKPVVISNPKLELLLIFWIKENYNGATMIAEVAQTRLQNIKESPWYNEKIHKVHAPPIQSIDEIGKIVENWTNKYGGKDKVVTREVGVVSHAAQDGPISYNSDVNPPVISGWPHQMHLDGWAAIDFNWKTPAFCVFYGCNTGHNIGGGFAKRISALDNFKNITVWGQSTSGSPSFFPDYRVTSLARSAEILDIDLSVGWDVGPTYMVGSRDSEGKKAILTRGWERLNEDKNGELKNFPTATLMNYFKNGNIVGSSHQGMFNDHRKNR